MKLFVERLYRTFYVYFTIGNSRLSVRASFIFGHSSHKGLLQTSRKPLGFVIVGVTRDSRSFHVCTRSCLQSVLIRDLHEKIELSPRCYRQSKERERKTTGRVVAVNAVNTTPHAVHFAGPGSWGCDVPQEGEGGGRGRKARVLKPKRARLRFPRLQKVECLQIGSRQDHECLLAGTPRCDWQLRMKYRVTAHTLYEESSRCTREA